MKKLLIIFFLFVLCLGVTACDMAEPTVTDTTTSSSDATTAAPDETTAAPDETTAAPDETTAAPDETTAAPEETTATPEEIIEEIKDPQNFKNVTIVMAGNVEGDEFDYTMKFADGNCLMGENGVLDEFYEGEEADMVRSIFVDTALALLDHADQFVSTENGFRFDGEITFEVDIIGVGPATIVSTNNVITLYENGDMNSLSCHMVQTSEAGNVTVDVTFTYSDYGTTVISPAECE